ncbi:MAG TPA: hypothetical protein DD412_05515 [Holosporales bacterium]|nr:hypothetical protein [Holosporales bacterium]
MKKASLFFFVAAGILLVGQSTDASATAIRTKPAKSLEDSIRLSVVFEEKEFLSENITINMPSGTKYILALKDIKLNQRHSLNQRMPVRELEAERGGAPQISYTINRTDPYEGSRLVDITEQCDLGPRGIQLKDTNDKPLKGIRLTFALDKTGGSFDRPVMVCKATYTTQ